MEGDKIILFCWQKLSPVPINLLYLTSNIPKCVLKHNHKTSLSNCANTHDCSTGRMWSWARPPTGFVAAWSMPSDGCIWDMSPLLRLRSSTPPRRPKRRQFLLICSNLCLPEFSIWSWLSDTRCRKSITFPRRCLPRITGYRIHNKRDPFKKLTLYLITSLFPFELEIKLSLKVQIPITDNSSSDTC